MATSGSRSQDSESTVRERARHLGGEVVDKVQETANRITGMGQESGGVQGGQGSGQSGSLTDQAAEQVSEQVTSRLDMGKEYLVETMTGVAQALRQTGQHLREEGSQPMLAQYVDRGAEQIERLGGHMRRRDANELLSEVEGFARRQPMVFAGGAFALGMLAVRFFRSSGPSQQQTTRSSTGMPGGGSFSGTSPMTEGATGGTTPASSSVPHGYAGTGMSTPSVPGVAPVSRPASQPTPTSPGSTQRSSTGPDSTTTPRVTPGTPTGQQSPRPATSPSAGRTTTPPGTTAPRPDGGAQPGGPVGGGSSGSGSSGSVSRNQP